MLIVQKYGGTSVGSLDRIKNVARRCLATQRQGHKVAVIVSAMSGETNRLLKLAHEASPEPDERELDVIASAMSLKGVLNEGVLQDKDGFGFAVEASLLLPSS